MECEALPLRAPAEPDSVNARLDRLQCRVPALREAFVSPGGTRYHVRVDDRGPIIDRVFENEIRRVSVVVYATYGEPNARIVLSRDHDFEDLRTHAQNGFIERRMPALAAEARKAVVEKERRCHRQSAIANALPSDRVPPAEVVYPLDAEVRDTVMEIERLIVELARDLHRLRMYGNGDDAFLRKCFRIVARASGNLRQRGVSTFHPRTLEMHSNSLMTAWRQARSVLVAASADASSRAQEC